MLTRGALGTIEVGLGLAAAFLLLAQMGCLRVEVIAATPANLQMADATFTPDFVTRGASRPAQVRYWVAPAQRFTVIWTEIRIEATCNFCLYAACPIPRPVPANPPTVTVRHRLPAVADTIEDASFFFLAGCPDGERGPAVFEPSETGEYLAHLTVPGTDPIPSRPGVWLPINVLPSSFTLPPRLMQPVGDGAWEWTAQFSTDSVKEAFDPRLRVGKVRILVARCAMPGAAPRTDECGADRLMDPAFTDVRVTPAHFIRVRNRLVPLQDCRGREGTEDGDIDLGPDPTDPTRSSLCRSQHRLVQLTPNYSSQESNAAVSTTVPLTWRAEFNADDGFPPPGMGEQVWIEFTLVPGL